MTKEITLQVNDDVFNELEYLIALHKKYGAPNPYGSVEGLLLYVASAIADGSRRPGAWERSMLESMGLVPDTPEAYVYRAQYGAPQEGGI